jgi:hypothetical protein
MNIVTRRNVSVAAILALVVILLAIAAGPALAVEPWTFSQDLTSPTTQSLTAGCAVDANNVWAGGGASTVARFNGTAWAAETVPIGGIFVGGLAAADATHIWAVGDNLDIFFSDGTAPGGNWVTQNSGGTGNFYGAYALDADNVWAVGGTTAGPTYTSAVYKWTGGPTPAWAAETAGGTNDQFKAVSGCDADHVWAVGYDYNATANLVNSHIYYRGPGHTWVLQHTLPGNGSTVTRLRGVKALSPTNVWAVGDSGTILHYNGLTWSADPQSGVVTTQGQYMVNATSADNVWSAGSGDTLLNFDGTAWTLFSTGVVAANHRTALPVSPSALWVTGQSGRIFKGLITTINSCDPTLGLQGQTIDVDIVSTATHFVNGVSAATFSGTGITVNSTTVTDPTHATADITIAAGAAPGARDVNVTTGAETPNPLVGGFTVKAVYTITVNAGAHGTIAPAGPVKVVEGTDQAFTITPAAGYHTANVVVDGVNLGNVTGYTFENVTTDHNISATFSDQYSSWYLAEGSSAWGFYSAINIQNPNAQDLNAKVTLLLTNGKTKELLVGLPKMSKVSVSPYDTIGEADFSTRVDCVQGKTIAVDRTVSWHSGLGQTTGETNSIGVTAPSTTWYLPEGSSNWGFETWLLIQNPNEVEASCDVTYMIEGVGPKKINHVVAPHSRATYNMMTEIGKADASIKVDSNIGVIPERSLYTFWPAAGSSGETGRREGHDSIGALKAATDFYLAEGTTAWGFTTYVLIQNPNPTQAKVTLTYMTNNGPVTDAPFTVAANSRKTVRVNDAHPGIDLSTKVHADKPIVAERSMFWALPDVAGQAATDSIGTSTASMTWCLPDGFITTDDGGTETFTLVQNPNSTDVTVRISYLNEGGKDNVVFTDTVPANSRKTYNMADKYSSDAGASASILVESLTTGKKVIVERSMYVNGRWGGTDTIGGSID